MTKSTLLFRCLKKTEIQLSSTQNSLEQHEHLLEPLKIKLKEYQEMLQVKEMDIKSLTSEVEVLRKSVQQQVRVIST